MLHEVEARAPRAKNAARHRAEDTILLQQQQQQQQQQDLQLSNTVAAETFDTVARNR
jgi:hypothetical protein